MYPVIRLAKEMRRARRLPRLGLFETHVSAHLCWPWDIDLWRELNNGRTLTLFDLGRIPMVERNGLWPVVKARGWALAIAGCSVRYRRRVKVFQRIEMRTRLIGWDARFFYTEQSMWRDGDCTNHVLHRIAATSADGIVPPAAVMQAAGAGVESPALPDWIAAWIAADAARPWPPSRD